MRGWREWEISMLRDGNKGMLEETSRGVKDLWGTLMGTILHYS